MAQIAAQLRRGVPLAPRTSMQVGGPAALGIELHDTAQLPDLLAYARDRQEGVRVLGQGSNVVVADAGLDGIVVWLRGAQMTFAERDGVLEVRAEAGADFGALCAETVARGCFGLAALSGIPGSVGASVLQNIGAYGQSLGDTLHTAEVVEVATGHARILAADALGLGYRTSHFKGAWRGRYIVTALTLRLVRGAQVLPPHAQLSQALGGPHAQPSPTEVAQAVLALRRDKGMLWQPTAAPVPPFHCGSFFTNPIVPAEVADALGARLGLMPRWPDVRGVKLSAAHLIEAAGFRRGWRNPLVGGRVGLSPRHALALSNFGGATAREVVDTAGHIQAAVLAHSNVALEPEPNLLGFA